MEVFGTKAAAAGIHVVLKMRQAVPLYFRPYCCITATAARTEGDVWGPHCKAFQGCQGCAASFPAVRGRKPEHTHGRAPPRQTRRPRSSLAFYAGEAGATLCREQQWIAHDQTDDQSQSRCSPRPRPERRFSSVLPGPSCGAQRLTTTDEMLQGIEEIRLLQQWNSISSKPKLE